MAQNQQYRISQLAKDMGMKSKEIIDAFESTEERKPMSVLTPDEFGLFIDRLTKKNEVTNLDDYLDGKVVVVTKGQKAKEKSESEAAARLEKEAEEKRAAEAKAAEEAEKKRVAAEKAAKVAHAAAAAQEIEGKARAAAQSRREAEARTAPRTPSPSRPSYEQNRAPQGQSRAPYQSPRPQTERPQTPRPQSGGQSQYSPRPQSSGQSQYSPRPQTPRPQTGAFGPQGRVSPSGDAPRFGDRFDKKPSFDKKPQKRPAFGKDGEPIERRATPKFTAPISQTVRTGSTTPNAPRGAKRVVDTRSTSVDLSKYDEKLDVYASAYSSDTRSNRQKLKKQDNRGQYSRQREKERLAAERLRKTELEKARKKQLCITVPDEISITELASRLKVTVADLIKKLMKLGVMATANQTVDYDTAFLVGDEFGAKVTKEVVVTIEEKLFESEEENDDGLVERSPVVCVMGHVDHGKTSLLDAIRHTQVTAGEAGGITQHIGAYRVNINGKDITFLDTPGHEAFTAMRARGAQATDIAILVVAADDGIMPQTIEAINHAKAAGIDIVVAINKMDKPGANPDGVMQELTKYDLVPEDWGGDVICVPVSALTGKGIEQLLESVLLVAEVKELRANPARRAKGIVIEAKLDKGRGPVATVLVQNGTLKSGDIVIAGTAVGRVRAMSDARGDLLDSAGPSVPVEIVGLGEVPESGDEFNAVEDERMARTLAEQRRTKAKQEEFQANSKVNLDDLFAQIAEGVKDLNIVVKADVGGSAEAVKSSLVKLSNEEVKVNVIHSAVGGITESDVMLASASNAIIVGFNVRPDKSAIDSAERQSVDIRTYRIIYECIEEITAAMKGMLAPLFKEVVLGHAEVRQTIHVPNVGTIAGSYITDGKITRASQIRVLRDGVVIFEDKISSLKRFKDDAKEVLQGFECGVGLEKFNDIKENDILEAFIMEEVAR